MDAGLEKSSPDPDIDSPSWYRWIPGIEAIDVAEHLSYNLGNVTKYIFRAGRKDPEKRLQDLRKAAWYLRREIERVEREEAMARDPGSPDSPA